eukprot:comp12686_c0_seq1/m.7778 comp12686_c0_seq1/g.7778  ORF comp12686_c0_seq1/g.7778 comp12686_c0_seq1/m.7778 type:complete len:229 (-) comp12686_c0_seq1:75-761(-)
MGKVKEIMRRMSLKISGKKNKTDQKVKTDVAPVQTKVDDMPESGATVAVAKAAESTKQAEPNPVPTVAASQVPEVTAHSKVEVQAAATPVAAPEVSAAVPHPVAYVPAEPTKVEPVVAEVAHDTPVVKAYEPIAAAPTPVTAATPAGPAMHTFEFDTDESAEVYLVGAFDGWQTRHKMQADGRRHNLTLPLAPGTYQYKFVVNGEWLLDQSKPQERDGSGNLNNTITL